MSNFFCPTLQQTPNFFWTANSTDKALPTEWSLETKGALWLAALRPASRQTHTAAGWKSRILKVMPKLHDICRVSKECNMTSHFNVFLECRESVENGTPCQSRSKRTNLHMVLHAFFHASTPGFEHCHSSKNKKVQCLDTAAFYLHLTPRCANYKTRIRRHCVLSIHRA